MNTPEPRWKRAARWLVPIALVGLLAVALSHIEDIALGLQWIEGQGPVGHLLFALFYLAGTVAMLPGSILEGGAGFLYGPLLGVPIASLLGTACATVSFLLGRTLLRSAVERRIANSPRLRAVDLAIGADGLRLVVLLRLSPLAPFNFLSLVLGATPLPVRDFALGTLIGHLFPVVVFVYLGSTVASALALVDRGAPPPWVTAAGLVLTAVATVGVSRTARRMLDTMLAPPGGAPEG